MRSFAEMPPKPRMAWGSLFFSRSPKKHSYLQNQSANPELSSTLQSFTRLAVLGKSVGQEKSFNQHCGKDLEKKDWSCRKKPPLLTGCCRHVCPHCWHGLRPKNRATPCLCLTSLRLHQATSFWWANKLCPEVGPEWSFFKESGWTSGELS